MDSAGFEPARWDHWLLIVTFVGLAIWGVWLSWRWERKATLRSDRSKLSRRLAMEIHRRQHLAAAQQSEGSSIERF